MPLLPALPVPIQRRQSQSMLQTELLSIEPARLVLGNQTIDLRPAPPTSYPALLFAHPSTSSPTHADRQMRCSDAYD
jgi:hypothetical protein